VAALIPEDKQVFVLLTLTTALAKLADLRMHGDVPTSAEVDREWALKMLDKTMHEWTVQ
jgi:hypothetical protein